VLGRRHPSSGQNRDNGPADLSRFFREKRREVENRSAPLNYGKPGRIITNRTARE